MIVFQKFTGAIQKFTGAITQIKVAIMSYYPHNIWQWSLKIQIELEEHCGFSSTLPLEESHITPGH